MEKNFLAGKKGNERFKLSSFLGEFGSSLIEKDPQKFSTLVKEYKFLIDEIVSILFYVSARLRQEKKSH